MKFNEGLGKESVEHAIQVKDRATWIAIGILVAAAVAMLGLSFSTTRSINVRLADANQVAARIAAGDLTTQGVQNRSADEIGTLLTSLDTMRGELARTIGEIVANSNNVALSASQLSSTAQQVSVSTEQQSSSTAAAAAAVEDLRSASTTSAPAPTTPATGHRGRPPGCCQRRGRRSRHREDRQGFPAGREHRRADPDPLRAGPADRQDHRGDPRSGRPDQPAGAQRRH
jgi:HAMP domain-containing protein